MTRDGRRVTEEHSKPWLCAAFVLAELEQAV